MNISGIRPVSGFYTPRVSNNLISTRTEKPAESSAVSLSVSKEGINNSFGRYDVVRQHKAYEGIRPVGIDKAYSKAEVDKAVNTMKKDESLHKYQTFVGENKKAGLIRSNELENFTL